MTNIEKRIVKTTLFLVSKVDDAEVVQYTVDEEESAVAIEVFRGLTGQIAVSTSIYFDGNDELKSILEFMKEFAPFKRYGCGDSVYFMKLRE